MAYKPTWRDIFRPTSTKKEKRTKKERKPVETAAAVEIDKGGLRRLLLDDFHKPLEKASAQNASAFSQFQQARLLGITILRLRRRKLKRNGTYTKLRTDPQCNPQKFPFFHRSFRSSAENLNLPRKIRKFCRTFRFSAEFAPTSAELLDFRWKIWIFDRSFRFSAELFHLRWNFRFFRRTLRFSVELFDLL